MFLKLDDAEKKKLDKQTACMGEVRSLLAAAEGGGRGGDARLTDMRQEQRRQVMELYRLTAEVKVLPLTQALFHPCTMLSSSCESRGANAVCCALHIAYDLVCQAGRNHIFVFESVMQR